MSVKRVKAARLWKACRPTLCSTLLAVAGMQGTILADQPRNNTAALFPGSSPRDQATNQKLLELPEPEITLSTVPPSKTYAQMHLSSLQDVETAPIDLASALALVGIQNPQFLAAQQRTLVAVAQRQLAAVKFLPTINLGSNFNNHQGVYQQSSGNILRVSRQTVFVGAGANALAAGTVNIPGVMWDLNLTESIYNVLVSQQVVSERQWAANASRLEVELRVAEAYLDVLQATALYEIAIKSRDETNQVVQLTSAFAKAGQGRPADAARAFSELAARDAAIMTLEGELLRTSALLAQQIGLDTATRLVPTDSWVVPHSIVPEPIPLDQLLVIALLQRPELQERQAAIRAAFLELEASEKLPFSPTLFMGFSAGSFGGGSNLATRPAPTTFGEGQDRYGNFHNRMDVDAMMYWTLRNMGVGNKAQIEASASRFRQSQWQQMTTYDRVRSEVASAFTRVHARYAQLKTAEEAIAAADVAWKEDLRRIRGNEGLPIEVLDSQRLLFESRNQYLRTIIAYTRAHYELYQSLGRPPAEMLIRTSDLEVPTVPPIEPAFELPNNPDIEAPPVDTTK